MVFLKSSTSLSSSWNLALSVAVILLNSSAFSSSEKSLTFFNHVLSSSLNSSTKVSDFGLSYLNLVFSSCVMSAVTSSISVSRASNLALTSGVTSK